MHIEPGIVDGAKMVLGHVTGAAALSAGALLALRAASAQGTASVLARTGIATAAVFTFFQILPHAPVGVSEVHLIFGSTLFLMLGAGPAALGLAAGLLLQGLFFAPADLPQYGMNVTTLLVPLLALSALARRVIPAGTAYVDLTYAQVFRLSAAYQGGIVAWVAFWAFYGQGFAATASVLSFGAAYMTVLLIEPLADLAILAAAKRMRAGSPLVTPRLHSA